MVPGWRGVTCARPAPFGIGLPRCRLRMLPAGSGGSGGRIALYAGRHSFASDSWQDWAPLRFAAAGGATYANAADAGAPGTIFIDAGSRNRTLLLDAGDPTRLQGGRYALIPEQATTLTLREIRLLRGAHLRLVTPNSPLTSLLVSTSFLNGDGTGKVSLADKTGLAIGTAPTPVLADVAQTDAVLTFAQMSAASPWTVTTTRTYTTEALSAVQASVDAHFGSSLLLTPSVNVNASQFDISGAFSCPASLLLQNGASWSVRPTAALIGSGTTVFTMQNVTMLRNAAFSVAGASVVSIRNLTSVAGGTVSLAASALAIESFVGSGMAAVTIGDNAAFTGTVLSISGGSLAIGSNLLVAVPNVSISATSSITAGNNVSMVGSGPLLVTGSGSLVAGSDFTLAKPLISIANVASINITDRFSAAGTVLEVTGSGLQTGNDVALSFASVNISATPYAQFGQRVSMRVAALSPAAYPAWANASGGRYALNGTFIIQSAGNVSSGNTTLLADGGIFMSGVTTWSLQGVTNFTSTAAFVLDTNVTLDATGGGYTGDGSGAGVGPGTLE